MGTVIDILWIQEEHWEQMLQDVAQRVPEEACGLVGGLEGRTLQVFPIENILHSPVRFRCDPHEQLRVLQLLDDRGWDLLAIYHAHPNGPAVPSPTDLAEAAYPEAVNLIWSQQSGQWSCRGFLIHQGKAQEIRIQRLDPFSPTSRRT